MNRIEQLFSNKQERILSIYFCAGAPKLEDTAQIIETLERNEVDLIEIGVPFSDPMADGTVIQAAATKALKNGMSLRLLFAQLQNIRERVNIPLILMGYLNPIMQYGFDEFCRSAAECGIDGVIIPDLPFAEYQRDYQSIAERYNIKVVMLITPETSAERIEMIDKNTSGFIYMVSSAATTGAQSDFDRAKIAYFNRINAMQLNNPRLVGFGISNKATYDAACQNSRGGIIGSRFVELLDKAQGDAQEAITKLKKLLTL